MKIWFYFRIEEACLFKTGFFDTDKILSIMTQGFGKRLLAQLPKFPLFIIRRFPQKYAMIIR